MTGSGELEGHTLTPGRAEGELLLLTEPLSFWGGLDRGVIVDRHHPQSGAAVAGRVLAMPHGRGSSSSSSVLAEAIRSGEGPAAVLLAEPDVMVALGAIVADEMYGRRCPVVCLDAVGYGSLVPGGRVEVQAGSSAAVVRMLTG